jgi:hypothetical protein
MKQEDYLRRRGRPAVLEDLLLGLSLRHASGDRQVGSDVMKTGDVEAAKAATRSRRL